MIKRDEKSKRGKIGVLFVCTGNTCRSPMAEIVFNNILKKKGREDVIVSSAGTQARSNTAMPVEAKEALKACGERVPRKEKIATPFSQFMYGAYDHIICMTHSHVDYLGNNRPNVYSLNELTGCGDIPDPYLYPLGTYINVCKALQNALNILYTKLLEGEK